ncbi:Holo-acyl-carrier-protein synthase [Corynebacterium pseudotuberculosis]|uniref:holo-ACP synthase AcpS n=1 Tax=Corynebacterium pseudotuberculosis TaxID=1719 RepID=UPI00065E7812|nr:holo-ACP synthase [Corynebacterium pseudotuberculosis]AKP09269.1 Holo-acyl-carrier-protein synthase [Corynebacterium pseudotuberculosis]
MFIGTDLVHVPSFAEQLHTPGSAFATKVFSALELRVAVTKPDRDAHLAGRWAAKEAFIKAWSQTLYGSAPVISADKVDWREIEIVPDAWGRVAVTLRGEIQRLAQLGQAHISISHDRDYAIAQCLIPGC